jgi:hypothetical protein
MFCLILSGICKNPNCSAILTFFFPRSIQYNLPMLTCVLTEEILQPYWNTGLVFWLTCTLYIVFAHVLKVPEGKETVFSAMER